MFQENLHLESSSSFLSWNMLNNIDEFNVEIYDMNSENLCHPEENLEITAFNDNKKVIAFKNHETLVFKNSIQAGRTSDNDFCLSDSFASKNHCSVEFQNWFKKKRSWVKSYSYLLRIKELPISICRYITEFLKKPRYIILKDLGSQNGTFVSLNPGQLYKLEENQRFRFSETLEMTIENMSILKENTISDIQEKIKETSEPMPRICCDYVIPEENKQIDFRTISIHFKMLDKSGDSQKIKLGSNKLTSRFSLGKSAAVNIPIFWEGFDDYQCEFVLDNGEWHIYEWHHESNKRTWLNLQGEKNKKYKIYESTEVLVGRSLLQIKLNDRS